MLSVPFALDGDDVIEYCGVLAHIADVNSKIVLI